MYSQYKLLQCQVNVCPCEVTGSFPPSLGLSEDHNTIPGCKEVSPRMHPYQDYICSGYVAPDTTNSSSILPCCSYVAHNKCFQFCIKWRTSLFFSRKAKMLWLLTPFGKKQLKRGETFWCPWDGRLRHSSLKTRTTRTFQSWSWCSFPRRASSRHRSPASSK